MSIVVVATAAVVILPAVVPAGVDVAKAQFGITDEQLGINYGAATGLGRTDVRLTAARIIRVALSLLGLIALVIVLIGGFTWMTAGGNEDKVGEAKKWIGAGIIGLAIILSGYSIVSFVISNLVQATQ